MKIRGKRRTYKVWLLNATRVGIRPTSVTVNLGLWRGVLWQAKKR